MTSKIAIITARGGSKRIPRKNIKQFHGNPIIYYPIEAALKSECFDEVMVSTDDEEIAKISKELGASVPFIRSEKNSDDYAGTADVLSEVLNEYKRFGKNFDICCCLYPTAPFITDDILKTTLKMMEEKRANSLIPIAAFPSPIQRALKLTNGYIERINPEYEKTRSQDLIDTYFDIGHFYWLDVETFLSTGRLLGHNTIPYIVSANDFHDIDTLDDWEAAEIKYQMRNLAN